MKAIYVQKGDSIDYTPDADVDWLHGQEEAAPSAARELGDEVSEAVGSGGRGR